MCNLYRLEKAPDAIASLARELEPREREKLRSYGPVDATTGRASIPVEKAIELVLNDPKFQLPVKKQPPSTERERSGGMP